MSHLILLRHAKAESVSDTGRDFDRGLTERGHRDAAIMGRVLADAGWAPDRVLVSAARRALETWDSARAAFAAEPVVRVARGLYLATVEDIARAVEGEADADRLLLIGHNPGLHDYAVSLAGGDGAGLLSDFPTAAAAVFERSPGARLKLVRVMFARDHGGGAT